VAGLMGGATGPADLTATLINDLDRASAMPPIPRARLLKDCTELVAALSKHVGDQRAQAVYEATRAQSAAEVAAELGVSKSAVDNLINGHMRRLKAASVEAE
jgi:DNA-directed RNA polymerase specialized sigma24 family protein